jgi:ketosteroid isomerase-like protein
MTTTTTHTFDASALRRAYSERDLSGALALYDDDARLELVDAKNTPSQPRRVEGRDQIKAHLGDVFERDLSHELDIVAVAPDALGYTLRCRYPDGTLVMCAATAELKDGKIVREVAVQAWDS